MPSRVEFRLRPQQEGWPEPFQHADGLRGLVYRFLVEGQPSLAERVHGRQTSFGAVSPLVLRDDGLLAFDVAFLDDTLPEPLLEGASRLAHREGGVRLGRDCFDLGVPEAPAVVWSYERLWEECSAGTAPMSFEFLTPTAIHATTRHRGRKVDPVPSPERTFPSWMRRWCQFAPPELTAFSRESFYRVVDDHLATCHLQGGTFVVGLWERGLAEPRPALGFVGSFGVQILRSPAALPRDILRLLQALARFSSFSGTGADTMRGLGQTRFLADGGPAEVAWRP